MRLAAFALLAILASAAPPVDRTDLNPWPSSEDHARLRAIWAMNDRRASLGLQPFAFDANLNRAASQSARAVAKGEAPHAGFPRRIRDNGWTGRASEGISFGAGTPEMAVLLLDSSPNPLEGHRVDFEDGSLTRVGIGFAKAMVGPYAGRIVAVVDYGGG
jgi:uncharacterized protein YkwD